MRLCAKEIVVGRWVVFNKKNQRNYISVKFSDQFT